MPRLVTLPSHMAGDGYYRVLLPAKHLRRHGWAVEVAPHITQRTGPTRSIVHYGVFGPPRGDTSGGRLALVKTIYDWLLERPFDILLMNQREEKDWPKVISALRAQGKRVYVDSDDEWFGLPPWNPGSKKKPGERARMVAQLRACDGMTVATPALLETYRKYQPNISVIRNRLDWGMWADGTPIYKGRPWKRLRVGWMGHAYWRRGDLDVLRPWIGSWLERHPDVDFVAAGDPAVHDHLQIPPGRRVSVAEVAFPNMDLRDITAVMDIGLVPLDLGTPEARRLNEAKSHLKGMEYNACGIPYVASPTESYRHWASRGGGGMIAESADDWQYCLDRLLDPDLRAVLGLRGHDAARRESLNTNIHEWADWLAHDIAVAA